MVFIKYVNWDQRKRCAYKSQNTQIPRDDMEAWLSIWFGFLGPKFKKLTTIAARHKEHGNISPTERRRGYSDDISYNNEPPLLCSETMMLTCCDSNSPRNIDMEIPLASPICADVSGPANVNI